MEIDEKRTGIDRDMCIVLRAVPYAEADLILTLFSRTHGRIDARAYGARSLKSRIRAACEPFCLSEFEFYVKNDRKSVKAADVRLDFFGIRDDFRRYACGCVLLEAAEKMLQGMGEEDSTALFLLLTVTLRALETYDGDPQYILLFFLIRALHLLGVFPSLHMCVGCGAPADPSLHWSAEGGGAVCSSCADEYETTALPSGVAACLAGFGRSQPGSAKDAAADKASVTGAVRALEDILGRHLGIRVRSMRLVHR